MSKVAIKKMLSPFSLVVFFATGSFACIVNAELKPMGDVELGEHVGQAMVAFDSVTTTSNKFTTFTMGLNTEFQVNVDELTLGEYDQTGETLAADIAVNNLSLGTISEDASKIQIDGNQYAVGDIVPFVTNNPYIELAKDTSGELVGLRLGVGEARGTMSGDFQSLSGNVGIEITDYSGQTNTAQLLNATTGEAKNTRAQYFGVDNTTTGGLTDCSTGSYCYALNDFKSLDIGARNGDGSVAATEDLFFSFQKENVEWQTSNGTITAGPGAFMNIPTAVQIDMNSSLNTGGIERARTEYIDRGHGMF